MYRVTEQFQNALQTSAVQHIRGTLKDLTGRETEITDNLCGDIRTESQCVSDSMQFGIGGMYAGSMECTLNLPYSMKDELKGSEISLDFGVETGESTEWIPLGIWTVSECTRSSNNRIKLRCYDNLRKLLCDTEEEKRSFVGVVSIDRLMKHVTSLTGVGFAQTLDELKKLSPWNLETDIFATHYGSTAWEEVRAIAQILGCFAFANRFGKIEFRRLDNTEPVLEITADRRHDAKLEEYTYSLKGLKYTDSNGYTAVRSISGARPDGAVTGFSDNFLVWENHGSDEQYGYYIENIIPNLRSIRYTPGEVSYYGNPALDVGDYVLILGGISGASAAVPFLVCCNTWQFRGAQTLTACGFSEAGTDDISATSKEMQQIRTINVTKSISAIDAESFPGEIFQTERTIAEIDFSCRAPTEIFIECGMTVFGSESGTASVFFYVDESVQNYNPMFTVHGNEYTAQHFGLHKSVSGGSHNIAVTVSGSGRVRQLEAYVMGQNITGLSSEPTSDDDYIYEISDGGATVLYYVGDASAPEMPAALGGAQVKRIEATAFSYADITSIYIPDGVERIE